MYLPTTNTVAWSTNTTERMRLDSSGNLCIGITTPGSSRLQVTKTSGINTTIIGWSDNANSTGRLSVITSGVGIGSDGVIAFSTNQGGTDTFNERMRLNASGALLVGYTTSQVSGTLLQVNSSVVATGYTIRNGTGGSYGPNSFNINYSSPNVQLWIDTTNLGNITITSDYRLKENVAAVSGNAIGRVMQLNPIQFNRKEIGIFKGSNAIEEGFFAHELQDIIPSAVFGEKDALTVDGGVQPQSLNWSPIVATLVKAMQEQQATIQSLTDRISQLEAK
jgi:hypothetical protein